MPQTPETPEAAVEPFTLFLEDEPRGDGGWWQDQFDQLRDAVEADHRDHHTGVFAYCVHRPCRVVNGR